jgi:hypothetical protein
MSYVKINREDYRLNVVTDSTGKELLLGGVATSLIVATLFSNKYEIPLRIITRTSANNPKNYDTFLQLAKIKRPAKVEFYSDYDRGSGGNHYKLETSDKDIFLSTSWWSSEAVRRVNLRRTFFYLLQEVEFFFYPHGDDSLLSEGVLRSAGINYIINSKLLHDYYVDKAFASVAERSIHFEPAFPEHMYSPGENSFEKKSTYRLFFYSRPRNPRNLYFTGLRLLDQALSLGIINKDEWTIFLAGSDVPKIRFSNGMEPTILGQLDWAEYLKFVKTVDLGFSLMYTPHPSYPPLDLASSGAVVLTNTYENKQALDSYSENIICANLDDNSMLKGFEAAVELSKDAEQRRRNYLANGIKRDWEKSLQPTLEYMYRNK